MGTTGTLYGDPGGDPGRGTRDNWTALLARGSRPLLKVGDLGVGVLRLQRA